MKKLGYKPRQSDPRDSAVSHCAIPFSTNKVNIVPINVKWDSLWNFSEISIYKQRRGNGLWGMSKRKRVFDNNERKFNYFDLFLFWIFNCILKIKLNRDMKLFIFIKGGHRFLKKERTALKKKKVSITRRKLLKSIQWFSPFNGWRHPGTYYTI